MKWLAVAFVAVLAHRASANECNEFAPQVASNRLPVGCPLTVYVHPDAQVSMDVMMWHAGSGSAISATVAESTEVIDVTIDDVDQDCVDHDTIQSIPYRVFTISDFDVSPGDLIEFDGVSAFVTAAAACTPPDAPAFYCTSAAQDCMEPAKNDDLQCNAGGASGMGAIVLVGVLLRRRRRR